MSISPGISPGAAAGVLTRPIMTFLFSSRWI